VKTDKNSAYLLLIAAFLFCARGAVYGIVLHPDGEPNLATWANRPDCNVVGRWSYNASCVAIAPNYIITTRHQGGSASSPVVIGGVTYTIDDIWSHPTADLLVVKLHSANLSSYAALYSNTNEIGQETVIGGYGRGRETTLLKGPSQQPYGYTWSTDANDNNHTQRWCTNKVEGADTASNGYTSDVITADFDALGVGSTSYEGISAEYDSSGGWFIKDGSNWKVAGLVRAVTSHGEPWPDEGQSWFSPPDKLDAVRISSYVDWIEDKISPVCTGPVPGDFNGDCTIDIQDFDEFAGWWLRQDCNKNNNWCQGSDFDRDGDVNLVDFAELSAEWLYDYQQM